MQNGYWMSQEEKDAAEAEVAELRARIEELEACKIASDEEIAELKQDLAETRVRSSCGSGVEPPYRRPR